MFATIILAALLIIVVWSLIGLVKVSIHGEEEFGQEWRFSPRGVFTVVGAVATFGLLLTGFFTVLYSQDPGQAKVMRSFTGRVVGTDTTDGMGFKAPWVSAIDYDMRNQVVSYVGDGNGQTGPAIPAQDRDGATATMDVVVRYSLEPTAIESIYKEFGSQDQFEAKLVQNDTRAVIRNVPLKYSTATFRLNREQAAMEMQKALATRWEGRDIRYPENIEKSLQAVQEATNNANKAKADLETAKVNAEKTRVEAQAQADYDQIVRCGAKTSVAKKVINGQEVDVTQVTPLQGAECQNRLNEQVLQNKYIDALKEMAEKGNLIVVPQGFNGMLNVPAR